MEDEQLDQIRDTIQGSRPCDQKLEHFRKQLSNAIDTAIEIRDFLINDDVSLLEQYELEMLREAISFTSKMTEALDDNPDSVKID